MKKLKEKPLMISQKKSRPDLIIAKDLQALYVSMGIPESKINEFQKGIHQDKVKMEYFNKIRKIRDKCNLEAKKLRKRYQNKLKGMVFEET